MDKDFELSLPDHLKSKILKKNTQEYHDFINWRFDLDTPNSPLFVVQASDENDIVETVKWCNSHKVSYTAVCGGHDPKSAITNGIVFDFSKMKSIIVDENNKTALIQPGCKAGDVENETSKYGLVFPLGHISSVGFSGLTLGGGLGHISRSLGLSLDSVLEYRVVTSDGCVKIVNKKENLDLWWGMKGAGFYFGIVSSFKVQLQPLKNIIVATYTYPLDKIKVPLLEISKLHNTNSNLESYSINLSLSGLTVFVIYNSETITEEAKKHCQHLASVGESFLLQPISVVPYAAFQKTFDAFINQGVYYEHGPFLKESSINSELVDVIIEALKSHPTQSGVIILTEMGGSKINDQQLKSTTCFPARESPFHLFFSSKIMDDSKKDAIVKWTDNHVKQVKHLALCEYPNTTYETHIHKIFNDKDRIDKLKYLKNKYDPNHLFNSTIKF